MLFNSLQFAIFFPVVTLLYFVLPQKLRPSLLLVASCVFYMAFVPKYVLILAFLILVDYTAGRLIENAEQPRRRMLLGASLVANVGILAIFKYFNFFAANVSGFAHFVGWNYSIESLKIILPIGLSFHTFQSMSYTIEVYRGRVKAEQSLLYFALYVMFYPQLVAGPIERPQNLLHQFREYHRFSWSRFLEGAQLMCSGLFKKIIIADRLALVVNTVYADPAQYSGIQLLMATWLFAIQIYCDFAGYSEIARGAAKVMGFELMVNFDRPYLATNIVDFWRRWHISLSTWFRDYVYYPLGGSRVDLWLTCRNLAIVFLISGFWHGANWTFIVWGALHALFMVTYTLTGNARKQLAEALAPTGQLVWNALSWLLTFNLVGLAWVFFRAANVSQAFLILRRVFTDLLPSGAIDLHPGLDQVQFGIAVALIAGLVLWEMASSRRPVWAAISRQPRLLRWTAYYAFAVAFVVLLLFNPQRTPQPFVYFQF